MNYREDIKALIDHELTPERAKEVREAIDNDILLQAEMHDMQQISMAIRDAALQPEPVGLEHTLRALEANKSSAPWWQQLSFPRTLTVLGGVAAFALAIVLVPKMLSSAANESAGPMSDAVEVPASSAAPASPQKFEDAEAQATPKVEEQDFLDKRDLRGLSNSAAPESPGAGATGRDKKVVTTSPTPTTPGSLSTETSQSARGKVEAATKSLDQNTLAGEKKAMPMDFGTVARAMPPVVVETALTLQVKDLSKTEQAIRATVSKAGGSVEKSRTTKRANATSDGSFVVKVPKASLAGLMMEMRKLGKVMEDTRQEVNVADEMRKLDSQAGAPPTGGSGGGGVQTQHANTGQNLNQDRNQTRAGSNVETKSQTFARNRQQELEKKTEMATVRIKLVKPAGPTVP